MNKLKKHLNAVSGWVLRVVMQWQFRKEQGYEYGTLNGLQARKSECGKVEFWAVRTNPAHSLWVASHSSHWHKFVPERHS